MSRGRRIVGSEVGEDRPPAYMRRGFTRRAGTRARPDLRVLLLMLLLALAAAAVWAVMLR